MNTKNKLDELWKEFIGCFAQIKNEISKTKALHINKRGLRRKIVNFVQNYFRNVRPHLEKIRVEKNFVEATDTYTQNLLRLTQVRSKKKDYQKLVRDIDARLRDIAIDIELKLSTLPTQEHRMGKLSDLEYNILQTLYKLVPSAALSYEQAIRDLSDGNRKSFRGVAHELREALREVLDHLAPDDAVINEPGFSFEKDKNKPTMKQKAKFILKARELSKKAINVTEMSINLIEEYQSTLARLARALYERSSISSHVETTKEEVKNIKKYIDPVLCELLQA